MKASLAKGMPHGYEVGYRSFTINGRMLGHGEPIRVKEGERVLFHILNGSATEIRSLALLGHSFQVIALDGNAVPNPVSVPVLWIGTAERVSAVVHMNHPGIWILGDLADDDRRHGMGIVVEYAGRRGQPQWTAPPPYKWSYARFAKLDATAAAADETFEMSSQRTTQPRKVQSLDHQRRRVPPDQHDDQRACSCKLSFETGQALSIAHAKRERRHSPGSLAQAQFRIGRPRWETNGRSAKRRDDAGRISSSGSRFLSRQSRLDALSLSPAASHGFWLHDSL